jgi:alcohol dehydrogenase (cytochrome c)
MLPSDATRESRNANVVSLPTQATAPPPRRSRWGPGPMAAIGILGLALLCILVPQTRWRLEAMALVLTGDIPDIHFGELLRLIAPGGTQPQMSRIIATHNPYAVVRIPSSQPGDIAAGSKLFSTECAACHGADAAGGTGAPSLVGREFKHGDSEWALYRTIRDGVPKTAMMDHPLGWSRIWQIVAYIRSIDVASGALSVPPLTQSRLDKLRVPFDDLAAISQPAVDWLNYSGSYSSTRHSLLTQITADNVSRLGLRWMVQLPDSAEKNESSPVVRNGILFMTIPPATVVALDAANGHRLWEHVHPYERKGGGEGPIGQNRGVAVLDDRVFVGTWDAKLTALSASTGKLIWESTVDPGYPSSYISAAPLALSDLVVTGVGTAASDSRGFIAAYDARTGVQRWRFDSIPGPGMPGNETWSGDSWKRGGAGAWMTGSYDPQSDTLYWGIGNPKPDFDASSRKGDNLYSNSVVALRGATGKLLWHFQFSPGDVHDWDSTQVPMIADRMTPGGVLQKRLLWANRNGFYYVLDRETGAFLAGAPFVRTSWAQGLDANGRPIRAVETLEQTQGRPIYPGAKGGTNWWPPTYDPSLDRVFIPVLEQGMVFFPTTQTLPSAVGRSFFTGVRALDASTGTLIWEHRQPARLVENDTGGLLSTRGGVVFGADQTRFFALDAKSGKLLWSVETGGTIMAAPVTYEVEGEQFVTVAAGRSVLTFALPKP